MNMLKADVVLSSTLGLEVYQWKRLRDVKWYVHVPHAVYDIALYRMFGIDYCNALLLTGNFQIDQARKLEEKRSLSEIELEVVGFTYMDRLSAQLKGAGPAEAHEAITALVVPSWGDNTIFALYGGKVIDALLNAGFHVIVRSHPQSFVSKAELMDKLQTENPNSDELEWNRDNDNFNALNRSDILASDFSGVVLEDAGTTVNHLLDDAGNQENRDAVRDKCWEHRGEAAVRIVDYLIAKRD